MCGCVGVREEDTERAAGQADCKAEAEGMGEGEGEGIYMRVYLDSSICVGITLSVLLGKHQS
jgi:hypothetical protein